MNNLMKIKKSKAEIFNLKNKLAKLDIKLFKHLDGELTDAEYKPFKEERAALRARIRELEKIIAGGK
ncbi:MAG: hypothetical protein GX963_15855 [Bacteroidales bacterium]|nr:hypothetical protein [Bacteroidales bacterium]